MKDCDILCVRASLSIAFYIAFIGIIVKLYDLTLTNDDRFLVAGCLVSSRHAH